MGKLSDFINAHRMGRARREYYGTSMSQPYAVRVEQGIEIPSPERTVMIARAIGVDQNVLLNLAAEDLIEEYILKTRKRYLEQRLYWPARVQGWGKHAPRVDNMDDD